MPTSLETLVQYRAARADRHESRRVWLFHSHTYFDHAAAECVAEAPSWTSSGKRLLRQPTSRCPPLFQSSRTAPARKLRGALHARGIRGLCVVAHIHATGEPR